MGDSAKGKNQGLTPPGKTKLTPPASPSIAILNGTPRVRRLPPAQSCRAPPAALDPQTSPLHGLGGPPRGLSEDEVKKRKNAATYCRPLKPKAAPPLPGPPAPPGSGTSGSGGSIRRKKPGTPLGFEEKRSVLKVGLGLGVGAGGEPPPSGSLGAAGGGWNTGVGVSVP